MSAGSLLPTTTLAAAAMHIERALANAGIDEPRREARLLLEAATGLSRAELIAGQQRLLERDASRVAEFLHRRAAHEPLSRILGLREFYGLDFELTAATLDPRPETEHLVEAVAQALSGNAAPRVLDLGTGTGAILIALARTLPKLSGQGIDIAGDAIAAARRNATRHGVAERLAFSVSDLFTDVAGQFTAIVSNPPYIPSADIAGLMPEVRLHDPLAALEGGTDGLDFYRRIISDAPAFLVPDGLIALECGAGQAGEVEQLLRNSGFAAVSVIPDLAGIPRVLIGRKGRL